MDKKMLFCLCEPVSSQLFCYIFCLCSFSPSSPNIHPTEKTLSGKKHKSLTRHPMVLWEAWKLASILEHVHRACITQDTQHTIRNAFSFVERNNTACLNLLFKLSWKENILNIKKRNLVIKLAPAIFPEFHCVALSTVHSFHPTTFFSNWCMVPVGWIWFNIKAFYLWWSFPLFSWPVCFTLCFIKYSRSSRKLCNWCVYHVCKKQKQKNKKKRPPREFRKVVANRAGRLREWALVALVSDHVIKQ